MAVVIEVCKIGFVEKKLIFEFQMPNHDVFLEENIDGK